VTNIEDELIKRAQSADMDAFCLLAKGYERRIYLLALNYCHNRQDAEDLSQEVWLKAYQALGTFRNESTFYTWLRRITINCFLNHRRARRYSWRGETTDIAISGMDAMEDAERVAPASTSETTLHNRILAKKVMQALSELTPPQRLIFLLKHHEGMTYEEIAKEVGCSTGTAKKSVYRAVRKLRQHLNVDVQSLSTFRALPTEIEIGV
jgi:RNA polymerase sigma-70 factor (ECF subfamily)